jgi:hypothetical protein
MKILAPALLAALLVPPAGALAQPFDPGPTSSVPGSSMSGARIDGAPGTRAGPNIPGADIFGDTVEERFYGRDYDNSYLRPRVPRGAKERSNEAVATEGRPDLNPVNAGEFATDGPNAIGRSSVTRGQSFSRGGRARIAPSK